MHGAPDETPLLEESGTERPLLVVGRIARVHGLRGEVSVIVVGDDPARMSPGRELWFEREGVPARSLKVTSSRAQQHRLLLRFEGIETREQAERLTGGDLAVRFDPRDLAGGEYYAHQLQGLEVLTLEGEPVGRVLGVVFAPGREFLEVQRAGRPTLMVPFHGDIVREVDLSGGRLRIDPPEGLLDL